MTKLDNFNGFLSNIDLDLYRERYSRIKLVELDLPREIQALPCIYDSYWKKQDNWVDFDGFYEEYKRPILSSLNDFRNDTMFSKETFDLGLPARIYRTWASLITQIQGGYVAGEIYGYDNIEMSAELDWKGIDFRIKNGNKSADIQIKKLTYSAGGMTGLTRQARYNTKENRYGEKINIIEYELCPSDKYKKDGSKRKGFETWCNRYQNILNVLDNNFVIFEKEIFNKEKLNFS